MKHFLTTTFSAVCFAGAIYAAESPPKVTFQDDVRAIFRESCCACHSQDDAASGLALDDYGAALGGGAGGEVLVAGDPDQSRLWRLVTHKEGPTMPPGEKLPEAQLAVIKQWIAGGLLDNAGSKPKHAKQSGLGEVGVSTDNRPQGEPAMPAGWFREPVVTADQVGPITTLAASPWAPLAAVPWQRQISLYRTDSLELVGVLPYPEGVPRVVRFSRDGSLLLVAGGRGASFGSAAVFDVKSGARLITVGEELDEVFAADISPNQALVALGGPKKKVRVYRTADGSLAYELGKHTDWITALQFSPDGKLLATADRSAGLLVWQAATGNARGDLRGHKQAITGVDWRADSAALVSASEDGEVRLWRPDGQPIKNFAAHGGGATSVAFARDGKLVTAGRDQKVTVWTGDGKPLKQLGPMKEIALAAVYAFDDKRVVAADFSGVVQLFEADSGKVVGELPPNPPTISAQLDRAKTQRESVAARLAPVQILANQSAEQLAAAKTAHEAFEKRLAEARSALDEAVKKHAGAQQAQQSAAAASSLATKRLGAVAEVLKATEQALAVAEKGLSEVTAGNSEESPGAVVGSLLIAVKHAKEDEASSAKAKTSAESGLQHAEQALKAAGEFKQKMEQALASVSSQRQALPDLMAAETAANMAREKAAKLRAKLASIDGTIASLDAERQALANALQQYAAEAATREQERVRLATLAGETRNAQTAAQAAAQKAQAEVDAVAQQLAQLQQQLSRSQKAREDAQAEVARLANEAESLSTKLSEAELAAARAKSREADFAAAEAARKVYLQEKP